MRCWQFDKCKLVCVDESCRVRERFNSQRMGNGKNRAWEPECYPLVQMKPHPKSKPRLETSGAHASFHKFTGHGKWGPLLGCLALSAYCADKNFMFGAWILLISALVVVFAWVDEFRKEGGQSKYYLLWGIPFCLPLLGSAAWLFQPALPEIVFKDSPALGIYQRYHIRRVLFGVRSYLVKTGFDVPNSIPPIGIDSVAMASEFATGSAIGLSDGYQDDELIFQYVASVVSPRVFSSMRKREGLSQSEESAIKAQGGSVVVVTSYADYFTASYLGRYPSHFPGRPVLPSFTSSIWELRNTRGQTFVDHAMVYSISVLENEKQPIAADLSNPDLYMARVFMAGAMPMETDLVAGETDEKRVFSHHGIVIPAPSVQIIDMR